MKRERVSDTPHVRARFVHAGAGDFGTYKTHKSRGLLVALVLLSLVRLGYFQRLYREYRHMITVSFSTIDSCRMIFMVSGHPTVVYIITANYSHTLTRRTDRVLSFYSPRTASRACG